MSCVELLTLVDVAQRLRISKRTAHDLVHRGELKSVVIGRRLRRVPADEVARYVEARLSNSEVGE